VIRNKKNSQNGASFPEKTPFPFSADRVFAGEDRNGLFFAADLSGKIWDVMICFFM